MPAPLLPDLPGHAPDIQPLSAFEKTVILSFAFGDSSSMLRRLGYVSNDMTPYGQSIRCKLGAHTTRWAELVYRAVVHRVIPASLPPRTAVRLDGALRWMASGLAAGQRPPHLTALLNLDARTWSQMEKRLLNQTGARSIAHAVYLSVRLIPWPWTSSGEWDAPVCIPLQPAPAAQSH